MARTSTASTRTTKKASSASKSAARKTSGAARKTSGAAKRTAGSAKKTTKSAAKSASGAAKRTASSAKKSASSAKKSASSAAKSATGAAKRTAGSAKKSATTAAKRTAIAAKRATGTTKKSSRSTSSGRGRAASTRGSRGPDALQLLIDDHDTVEALFKRFEKTGSGAKQARQEIVTRVIEELSVHAVIEEQAFYPAVRTQAEKLNDDVLEALEEHHIVKWVLDELQNMGPDDERYEAKFTVLMENVRHHVEEEESEMFPRVRKALSREQLETIGAALAEAKTTAPRRPHPRSPDTPPGNLIAGALSAPLDAARSVGENAVDAARTMGENAVRQVRKLAGGD